MAYGWKKTHLMNNVHEEKLRNLLISMKFISLYQYHLTIKVSSKNTTYNRTFETHFKIFILYIDVCYFVLLCSEVLLMLVFNHLFDPKCASYSTPLAGVSKPPYLDDPTEMERQQGSYH